jgi:predicted AlkP superfamily pyrophosphatase or phosphodiesterase
MKLPSSATLALAFAASLVARGATPPPLILISLDGFRWDYCAKHPQETPHLRKLAAEGVSARALIPVFPSNTFPNHYSIVTGLYPSHHGIINNDLFDQKTGAFFHYKSPLSVRDPRWWGGEPIWATAVRQGRTSATCYWVGAEAESAGVRPTYWRPYDYADHPFAARIEEIVRWLRLPEGQRPAVLALYYEETNSIGHRTGPDSAETAAAIRMLDAQVGAITDRLGRESDRRQPCHRLGPRDDPVRPGKGADARRPDRSRRRPG